MLPPADSTDDGSPSKKKKITFVADVEEYA